jgi:hypothetical protein
MSGRDDDVSDDARKRGICQIISGREDDVRDNVRKRG